MKGQHIMNKELIKLDNNTGIVSNELGTLNIIKTNNARANTYTSRINRKS